MHLDEINIQTVMSFTNKAYTLGASENNDEEITNSMQVFLLTTLHGKNIGLIFVLNLCATWKANVCNQS